MSASDLEYNFISAAGEGDIQKIQQLLDQEVDIDVCYERLPSGRHPRKRRNRRNALITPASEGRSEIVSLLLDRGAKINMTTSTDGYGSALCAAASCKGGSLEIVSALLDNGADVNQSFDCTLGSALCGAAYSVNKDIVALFLNRGPDVNMVSGGWGSALCAAARSCRDNLEVVSLLLDRGADVNMNVGGAFGFALCAAAARHAWEHEEVVSLLLDRGADVNMSVCSKYGSALCAVAHEGNMKIVSLLLDRGADVNMRVGDEFDSALCVAARKGRKEIVSLLLDRGADVNMSVGGELGSALCVATHHYNEEIVSLLLDRGVDVDMNVGGKYGSSLCAAAHKGNKGILTVLLDRGTDVNMRVGGEFGSALCAAAHWGDKEIVSLLLDRGANVNMSIGSEYKSALCKAAYHMHNEVLLTLLGRGANINYVDGYYGSALSTAAYKGREDTMKLLLDQGAGINLIGARGRFRSAMCAIMAAYEDQGQQKTEQAIQLLLDHKADINLILSKHGSVLGMAAYRDNKELVLFLLAREADAFHVGGNYKTASGEIPTALDAACAGNARSDVIELLKTAINNRSGYEDATPWPPLPMPFTGSHLHVVEQELKSQISPHCFENIDKIRLWDYISPEQADLPYKKSDEAMLRRVLVALVGIDEEAAKGFQISAN